MPPKKNKRARTSESSTSRASSPSSESRQDEAANPTERAKIQSATSKLSHTVEGKLARPAWALQCVAEKKSESAIWSDVVPFERLTTDNDFDPATMLKIVTWNVAGLRGMLKKNEAALSDFVKTVQPDILCLQETKLNYEDEANNTTLGVLDGYGFVDHPCRCKKGYSGTRTYIHDERVAQSHRVQSACGFTAPPPPLLLLQQQANTCPDARAMVDEEGRVLTTLLRPLKSSRASARESSSSSTPALAIVNTYIPNSGMTLNRLSYRADSFDVQMRAYLKKLNEVCMGESTSTAEPCAGDGPKDELGGFIWTGDLNVAERDYDRYYMSSYQNMQACSGFTPEERYSFRQTLQETNAVDVFRALYPRAAPAYTFWSARINGRARGMGWRLDYFVVSAALAPRVVDCFPMPHVMGSDHCPVQLWLRRL